MDSNGLRIIANPFLLKKEIKQIKNTKLIEIDNDQLLFINSDSPQQGITTVIQTNYNSNNQPESQITTYYNTIQLINCNNM